jgi:SRSO17 transposase
MWRVLRAELPERRGLVLLDDTAFPKKGTDSVGVARQYSGPLGKIGNCQVAVTAALWTGVRAWLVAAALYLPESWANDAERCERAHVPTTVRFRKKWQIALKLLQQVRASGITVTGVLSDSGYGDATSFRTGLHRLTLPYGLGISETLTVFLDPQRLALPRRTGPARLVQFVHQRWLIEQQYQQLKTELGLDHFEGRTYPGWTHHVVVSAVAYAFLQQERRQRATSLTFEAIQAIVQEILVGLLFASKPRYAEWLEEARQLLPLRL